MFIYLDLLYFWLAKFSKFIFLIFRHFMYVVSELRSRGLCNTPP